jgi:Multiubiquitin
MSDQIDARSDQEGKEHQPVTVVINDKHVTFPNGDVTGRQIKEAAGIPLDYSLYLRHPGDNEPISNDELVELHEGDRFFSRPPSNVS